MTTTYLKATNGGRVHAMSNQWNRFGQLTHCGKVFSFETSEHDRATCRACLRIEKARLFTLDPNRRPLAAGTYDSEITAVDGLKIAYRLTVEVDGDDRIYTVTLADGTYVDSMSRRYLATHGTTGWWATNSDPYLGRRADAAYATFMEEVQHRLALRDMYEMDR